MITKTSTDAAAPGAVGSRSPGASPVTVLHVAAPAPFGGLETVLRSLVSGLTRRGHEMHVAAVITPGSTPHRFVEALPKGPTGKILKRVLRERALTEA